MKKDRKSRRQNTLLVAQIMKKIGLSIMILILFLSSLPLTPYKARAAPSASSTSDGKIPYYGYDATELRVPNLMPGVLNFLRVDDPSGVEVLGPYRHMTIYEGKLTYKDNDSHISSLNESFTVNHNFKNTGPNNRKNIKKAYRKHKFYHLVPAKERNTARNLIPVEEVTKQDFQNVWGGNPDYMERALKRYSVSSNKGKHGDYYYIRDLASEAGGYATNTGEDFSSINPTKLVFLKTAWPDIHRFLSNKNVAFVGDDITFTLSGWEYAYGKTGITYEIVIEKDGKHAGTLKGSLPTTKGKQSSMNSKQDPAHTGEFSSTNIGTFKPAEEGVYTATITVNDDVMRYATKSVNFTVMGPLAKGLYITPPTHTVKVGGMENYKAYYVDNNGNAKDVTHLAEWSSSDTSIAHHMMLGRFKGKKVGTIEVRATYDGMHDTAEFNVVDEPPPPPYGELVVTPPTQTIYEGETAYYKATFIAENGMSTDVTGEATWSIQDSSIASNGQYGVFKGLQQGQTFVTATFNGLSDDAELIVLRKNGPPIVRIIGPTRVYQYDDFCLEAEAYDADGEIVSYDWTYTGKGNLSGYRSCGLSYEELGFQDVSVTVADNDGATASDDHQIEVIPLIPRADFRVGGTLKENRKMTLEAFHPYGGNDSLFNISPIVEEKWTITAKDPSNQSKIFTVQNISGNLSYKQIVDWLVKEEGEYTIKRFVKNAMGYSDTVEKTITVLPDLEPIADFTTLTKIYRDDVPASGNAKAHITITDNSYSKDDFISKRVYTITFDSDNDGDFTDETPEVISTGNEREVVYITEKVGNYKIELDVMESFGQPTIAQFVDQSENKATTDRRYHDTNKPNPDRNNIVKPDEEKIVNVDNLEPVVDYEVRGEDSRLKKVELQIDLTKSPYSEAQLTAALPLFQQRLKQEGIDGYVTFVQDEVRIKKGDNGTFLTDNGDVYSMYVENGEYKGDSYGDGYAYKIEGFPSKVVDIYGGGTRIYAFLDTGDLYAWGSNYFPVMGTGDKFPLYRPKKVPIPKVSKMPEIRSYTLGSERAGYTILTDKDMYITGRYWGDHFDKFSSSDEQILTATNLRDLVDNPPSGNIIGRLGDYLVTDSGRAFTYSLFTGHRISGTVSQIYQAPRTTYTYPRVEALLMKDGSLRLPYIYRINTGNVFYNPYYNPPTPIKRFVNTNSDYVYILFENNEVYKSTDYLTKRSIGYNDFYIFDLTELDLSDRFTKVEGLPNEEITDVIYMGLHHDTIYYLFNNGDLYIQQDNSQPTKVNLPSKVTQYWINKFSTSDVIYSSIVFFKLESGELYAHGTNHYGELGVGKTSNSVSYPTKVDLPGKIKDVNMYSSTNTFFILENGEVYASGENQSGMLGVGTTIRTYEPQKVDLPDKVVDATKVLANGAQYHTYFILQSGDVYAAGENSYGNLINGTRNTANQPFPGKVLFNVEPTYPFRESPDILFTSVITEGKFDSSKLSKGIENLNSYFIGVGNDTNLNDYNSVISANTPRNGQSLDTADLEGSSDDEKAKDLMKKYAEIIIDNMPKESVNLRIIVDESINTSGLESKLNDTIRPLMSANNIPFGEITIVKGKLATLDWYTLPFVFSPYTNREVVTVITDKTISTRWTDEIEKVMGRKPFLFVGIGNTSNKAALDKLVRLNDLKGTVFTSVSNMDTYVAEYSQYIIDSIIERQSKHELYFTIDETLEYLDYYWDYENDKMMDHYWKFAHLDKLFENSTGKIPNADTKIDAPITQFSKTGRYNPIYAAQDDPLTPVFDPSDIPLFEEYRKWSDEDDDWYLYAHNRPSAEFEVTLDSETGVYSVKNIASDIDRESHTIGNNGKGIWFQEWSWRYAGSNNWNPGLPSSPLSNNTVYEIKNRVIDFQVKEDVVIKTLVVGEPEVELPAKEPRLEVTPPSQNVKVGETASYKAEYIDYVDNNGVQEEVRTDVTSDPNTVWSSGDPSIATSESNGVFKGVTPDKSTKVIAEYTNSDGLKLTGEAMINVYDDDEPPPEDPPPPEELPEYIPPKCTVEIIMNPGNSDSINGNHTTADPTGKITESMESSQFDVLSHSIPSSEYLKVQGESEKYLVDYEFVQRKGTVVYTIELAKDYLIKRTVTPPPEPPSEGGESEGGGDGEEGEPAEPEPQVQQNYQRELIEIKEEHEVTFWKVGHFLIYKLDQITFKNYALPNESVTVSSTDIVVLDTRHEDVDENHIITKECKGIYLGEETIELEGEDSQPDFSGLESEARSKVAESFNNRIPDVKNDYIEIDSTVYMNDAETPSNGPRPTSIPRAPKVSVEQSSLLIDPKKANRYRSESSITAHYSVHTEIKKTGNALTFTGNSPSKINVVTVHTPTVMYARASDDKEHDQRTNAPNRSTPANPNTDRHAFILDRPFTVTLPTSGQHINAPGYGNRDYAKYIQKKEVKFPFDVYTQNKSQFYPANTWINIPVSTETETFFLPVWVPEGQYTVEYRSFAINSLPSGNYGGSESEANTSIPNGTVNNYPSAAHVATDTIKVDVVGRLYDFRITDITDYNWQSAFRKSDGVTPKGNSYWVGQKGIDGQNRGNSKQNTLPVRHGSHPEGYKNVATKKGYTFRFDLKTKGDMFGSNDGIRIKPTFYFVNKDGTNRREVDLYYHNENNLFVKVGSEEDTVYREIKLNDTLRNVPLEELTANADYYYRHASDFGIEQETSKYYKTSYARQYIKHISKKNVVTGPYGWQILNWKLRTYRGPEENEVPSNTMVPKEDIVAREQTWYGEYSIPANVYAVSKGTKIRDSASLGRLNENHPIFLRDGYIIVNFDIETIRNGDLDNPYLQYINARWMNQWYDMEGYSRSFTDPYGYTFQLKDGDVIFYHGDASSTDDFSINVTH